MDRAFAEIVAAADSSDFVFPPQQSFLYPSYPNPFRTESTIRYDLLQPTNVEIAIFNALGQRVTTLVDEPQLAGTHTVVWRKTNAADLATASGVYYVRMRAGAYTETRKLLLVK